MKSLKTGLIVLAILTCPGCKKVKKCPTGKVAEVKKWIHSLCEARMAGLTRANPHLAGSNLVQANVAPVRTLPRGGTFARLEPGQLWVDGKRSLDWPAAFGYEKKTTARPRPAAKKKKPVPEGKIDDRVKPNPGRGAGMLGVLSKMTGKLGVMFSRNPPHPAIKELKTAVVKGDRVYLAVAPMVPAVEVHGFLRSAYKAGFRRVVFLFRPKKGGAPVPAAPVTEGYVKFGPTAGSAKVLTAARAMADRALGKWKKCMPMVKAMEGMGLATVKERCRRLKGEFLAALNKCGCAEDVKPLLAAWHMVLQPYDRIGTWSLNLDEKVVGHQVQKQGMKWQEVALAVLKRSENSKFFLVTPEGKARWSVTEDALGALMGRSIGDGGAGMGGLGLGGSHRFGGGGGGGGIGFGGFGLRAGKGPRVSGGTAAVRGALDKNVIRRVIRRHLAEVKYCYVTKGLMTKKGLKGTVRVQFVIGTKGYVGTAKVQKTTLKHLATERCILAAVRRWRFPKPEGGGIVLVTYPFQFKPPSGKRK